MLSAYLNEENEMTDDKRTLRGIDPDAWAEIEAINLATGVPYGRLVTRAIQYWLENLDMDDPVPVLRQPAKEA